MFLSTSRLNLGVNVFAALLLVTILNAYILHTRFQVEAEKDIQEHFVKHIHVNKQTTPPLSKDPKLLSSNNPNPNNPKSDVGGGGSSKQDKPHKTDNDKADKTDKTDKADKPPKVSKDVKPGSTNPTKPSKGSKYHRDTCLPRPTREQALLDLPLTVVTATSEGYVGHVHNLIGSVHHHQPDVEIAVYNLGFDADTTRDLESYCGVTVHKLDFNSLPPHVTHLKNFAWKALVVQQALLDYGKILYLDSGYEIRRPLDFIRGRIEREGYFCTGMGDSLTRGGRETMFNYFHTSTLEYLGLPMTAGGVHGATYWGGAYEGIILPATECSKQATCITPDQQGDEVRSFGKDQPLFSNLVYRGGCTQCAMSNAFTAHSSMSSVAGDPFVAGKQHLFHRRGSGPFNGNGKRRSTCPDRHLVASEQWQALRSEYNTTFLGNNGCPHTRFSQKVPDDLYMLGDVPASVERVVTSVRNSQMAIVTAAGPTDDTARLNELLTSVAEWEPDRQVVVYDLGLERDYVATISLQKNVIVEEFKFESYPAHVRDLTNTAWRPLVLSHAYMTYGSFLYITASHVLYQRLDTLIFQLQRDGIFSATVGGNLLELFSSVSTAVEFFAEWPAVAKDRRSDGAKLMKEFEFKPQCTAAVVGFWKDSIAAELILPPLYDCSMDPTCWENSRKSVADSKATDQLLLSLMIYDKVCYTCNRDYDFYAYAGKRKEIIHTAKEYNLFAKALIDEVQVLYDTIS